MRRAQSPCSVMACQIADIDDDMAGTTVHLCVPIFIPSEILFPFGLYLNSALYRPHHTACWSLLLQASSINLFISCWIWVHCYDHFEDILAVRQLVLLFFFRKRKRKEKRYRAWQP